MPFTQIILQTQIFNNFFYLTKGNANSYVAFIELSLNIMKSNSLYAMIIPNTWLSGNNFFELRKFILDEKILKRIIQLPYDIFEVYVDTVILFLEKGLKAQSTEYYKFSVKDDFEMNFLLRNISYADWNDENLTFFLDNDFLQT